MTWDCMALAAENHTGKQSLGCDKLGVRWGGRAGWASPASCSCQESQLGHRQLGWVPHALTPASLHCLLAVSPSEPCFPSDLGSKQMWATRYKSFVIRLALMPPIWVNTALTFTAAAAPPVPQLDAKMLPGESHAGPSLGIQGVWFASQSGLKIMPTVPASWHNLVNAKLKNRYIVLLLQAELFVLKKMGRSIYLVKS